MQCDIWYTTQPTEEDLPVKVYTCTGQLEPVIYERSLPNVRVKFWQPCNPSKGIVGKEFQKLANMDGTVDWQCLDWFKAGYTYCQRINSE